MNGESQGSTNMVKMVMGIVLIAAGNILAINGYPKVPTVTLPAHTAPLQPGAMVTDVARLSELLPRYYWLLMLSLLLINMGSVFLYLCREEKKA